MVRSPYSPKRPQFARGVTLLLCYVLAMVAAIALAHVLAPTPALSATPLTPYVWNLPSQIPRPIVPADNPMSVEKVALGRRLFFETRLSITGQISCATCHDPRKAFTDGKPVSIGATGEAHPRNSMSLTNVGYNSVLTWANPLMKHLETQLLVPLFGEHPVEMGLAGQEDKILAILRQDSDYCQRFMQVFGPGSEAISIRNLAKAIAAFERSLVSFGSPYDRYRYGGDANAISAAAKRGEQLFNSETLECFHCHGGLNFSDMTQHERLAFPEIAFHNTGLYNLDAWGAYPAPNTGVHELSGKPEDMGRFKAPTLRNIALTAPYMHDGSIATLEEVIAHYAAGGRTIEQGEKAGIGSQNPFKSQFISGFQLTTSERQDLLAFLESLTDRFFIENPAHRDPSSTSD